jgi:hypothetical protein
MTNTVELVHGEIKAKLLFCTRSSMLWQNEMQKVRGNVSNVEDLKSDMLAMDKYIYGLYICHQCYCEDENIDVKVKRSQFYDIFFTKEDNSNVTECIKQFSESMGEITKTLSGNLDTKKKKEQVKPTIN